MFCLQCGAEMAVRAQTCPVCGHVYGERERSLVESKPARASTTSAQSPMMSASARAARPTATVKYVGDSASPGLPRDLPGRFVLGVALGMAADLLLPWISVNGENITPVSVGAPVVVVLALLAAATLPVYTASLRQHPVWSALPMIVGAFCAGIGGSVWLLLAPLAQIFAASFGSDPSNVSLAPQGGLYLFLLGAGMLLVSGQRMLVATQVSQLADARRDAIRSVQAKPAVARPMTPMTPMTPMAPMTAPPSAAPAGPMIPASSPAALQQTHMPTQPAEGSSTVWRPKPPTLPTAPAPPARAAPPVAPTTPATPAPPTSPTSPAAPSAPVVPVLPGSDAWNRPPTSPAPLRPAPGGGWGKPRGPQRLR